MWHALIRWLRGWLENPETFLLGAVALMTLLGMSQSHSGPSKAVFWLLCVPVVLWILIRRQGCQRLWRSVPVRWGLGLLLLYLVSIVWSVFATPDRKIQVATHTLETILFVLGVFFAFQASDERKSQFAKLLVVSCIIGSLVSLITFYAGHSLAARLNGSAVYLLGYPTTAPLVLLGCLMTATLFMDREESKNWDVWILTGFIAVGLFIFMTQSRGPLISFGCLALLWGAFCLGIKRTLAIFVVLLSIAIVAILMTHAMDTAWRDHLATGLNGRLVIWMHVVQAVFDRPWLGYGGASFFPNGPASQTAAPILGHEVFHPHSMFFSMLYYFGLLGVVVWIGFLLSIIRGLWAVRSVAKWPGFFALLCLLLMTASDTHTLVAEVSKEWWIWWVPSMALAAFQMQERGA